MKRFRYIILPNILWYITGRFIFEFLYDYWWVVVVKRKPIWSDADSKLCPRKFCRYCGRNYFNH